MDSHIELVDTWGLEPCESSKLSTSACAFGRGVGGAPRPSGAGRGIFEVQTSLNNSLLSYGPWHSAGEKEEQSHDKQISSPATAPSSSLTTPVPFQGNRSDWADGKLACTLLVLRPRVSGDLENSLGATHV